MTRTLALDLGTTRIKLGSLEEDGRFTLLHSVRSPALEGKNGIRISDPRSYVATATDLLRQSGPGQGIRLGLSTQRSSFLLWRRDSGEPRTPLISWQDLRAARWCLARASWEPEIRDWTGLPFSAHYAGPKLAVLLAENADLRGEAERGELLFGTLETFLVWNWTGGRVHVTDLSVAARTLMVDFRHGGWCPALLEKFGVPHQILPTIRQNNEASVETELGHEIVACIGDQAAGALPIFAHDADCAYINAGTGTFVMRNRESAAPQGYLTALVGATPHTQRLSFWEGAVHAGARLLGRCKSKLPLTERHAARYPECYAIADDPGLAAPYWRADLSSHLSMTAHELADEARDQILLESYLFRIREVVEGLFKDRRPDRIVLSGGLARRVDFASALAAIMPVPLDLVAQEDLGLHGAAWLASGCGHPPEIPHRRLAPASVPSLLRKYARWRSWMLQVCA